MAFDPSLDIELDKREKIFESTKIIVALKSYNNSKPKIQISRQNKTDEGWKFSKVGRLTKEEAEALHGMLTELIPKL